MKTVIGMGIYVQTYRMQSDGFYVPVQARYDEEEHKEAMADEEWSMTVPTDRIILPPTHTHINTLPLTSFPKW
jgi:hypothetical protein